MSLDSDSEKILGRALGYPYARPAERFVFSQGVAQPWPGDDDSALFSTLTPVLAVGSNAAPQQLCRKFGRDFKGQIPVTFGVIADHDVVYAAYITGYGSVPATLTDSPGTQIAVAITWLDDAALARMHETESVGVGTQYGELSGMLLSASLGLTVDAPVSRVCTWRSLVGELSLSHSKPTVPTGLKELAGTNRRYPLMNQIELQRAIWRQSIGMTPGPETSFESWVLDNVNKPDHRSRVSECLQARALNTRMACFTPL